jgi:putative transposase
MPIKSIKQNFTPNLEQMVMMEKFRHMVNDVIKIGLERNCSTMKKLSLLSYHALAKYNIMSYYRLTAISQAASRLTQHKKDAKNGKNPKTPYVKKLYLVSCYGFKVNGMLLSFPVQNRNFANILLNKHTERVLSEKPLKIRSFTITPTSLSISIQKDIEPIIPESIIGIDRNLRNITLNIFPKSKCVMYKTNKVLSIKENTVRVIGSFRRSDRRVKGKFYAQKRNRQTRRINQYLHKISKDIVQKAKEHKSIITFENLKGIRKLYRKGNGQGRTYRRKMNGWPFYELQRQIQYKAAWEGLPVSFVDPKRTSMLCPICRGLLQEDRQNRRKMMCINCMKSMDRDVVASLNIAYKEWSRFCHSRGLLDEAMKGNPDFEIIKDLVILRVYGSKLQVVI